MSKHTPFPDHWRTENAERLTVIVDAEGYFRAVKEAMLSARHSIMLIGWDFDARVEMEPEDQTLPGPNKIGRFLNHLSKQREDLDIRILKWDVGAISAVARGETPFFLFQWMFGSKVKLKLDHAHPPMSAHHTKLVVIDDCIAFCGGIDMTMGRWDTRTHDENRPGRRTPRGKPLRPWHDATTCVTGDAARALGELARLRWQKATGEELAPPPASDSICWPASLTTHFTDIDVRIARTAPEYDGETQISEIEAATLDIIRSAKRSLYIESQYFASRKIACAIIDRLKEPEGPDVVVINPFEADGWLEIKTMDAARVVLMDMVHRADVHDRFRILYPHNEQGTPIYVHAKIMIADDEVLKVGSANLNNRSMGFDSECDIIIRAQTDEHRRTIAALRTNLLAEHLDATDEEVAEGFASTGSLVRTVASLAGRPRSLRDVPRRELSEVEERLAESDMADPERPPTFKEAVLSLTEKVRWSRR